MRAGPVNGARIGIPAGRRAAEQAALVRAMGGVPVLGAAVRADAPASDAELVAALRQALAAPIDHAVFLTGMGVELTLAAAARHGLERPLRAALAAARVTARGPKPRRALRAAGIRIDRLIDPPHAAWVRDDLLEQDLTGRSVLLQGFGPPPEEIAAPARAAGARVSVLLPYAATLPHDPRPAQDLARAAAAGGLSAVAFTSAQAARQFVALAEEVGLDARALGRAPVCWASIGTVTSAAMRADGLPVHVEADPPRMGALYRAIAAALTARSGPPVPADPLPGAAAAGGGSR